MSLRRLAAIAVTAGLASTPAAAWKNGGTSTGARDVKFGTHDYVAHHGHRLANRGAVAWLTPELLYYYLGTEAPDVGPKLRGVIGRYRDTSPCHCILFDAAGNVTNDFLEIRVREEFDKAQQALADGQPRKAAFYAGAMAHYIGDLSQFMHLMGKESHWGAEDQGYHRAYEAEVEKTIKFKTRSSELLDPYLERKDVDGDAAGEIAQAVAWFTESGYAGMQPGRMYTQWRSLVTQQRKPWRMWPDGFRDRTGANVNYAVNAMAELLERLGDDQ